MHDTRISRRYVLIYTAAFALVALAVFFPFLTAGKSLVGNGDGQSQYILQLRYMGEWLRETARGFLHGNFALRTYDFTIGMGDDINAVVRFHPLDYLSVFIPAGYTEQLYAFLILLRLYLAGLAFSLYAFYWKAEGTGVLSGALTYLFCGFVFELGIVHPIYVAPMIVTPLLLLGAEYMMEGRRRHSFALFSLMVYLGFTSNYYFMYIGSVALLVYVLIRFFVLFTHDRVRAFFSLLIRMTGAYLVGLMMSCVTLLPTLDRYFHSYRSANLSERGNLFFYEDFRRYFAWFVNLISPLEASGNGTHLNFSVVVLPAIVVLLCAGRGKWKSLKRVLLALLVFLLLPLGGYIMAVMHTENNRWVYLISLAAAMCVAFASGFFLSLNALQRRALAVTAVLFDSAVLALTVLYPVNVYHILAAAELTLFVLVRSALQKKDVRLSSASLVLAVTVVSVILGGYFTFGGRFGNLTRYYAPRGTTESFFSDSEYANYALAAGAGENEPWERGFYRVDGIWDGSGEDNASLQLGYPGVQIYNSVLNAAQIKYLLDTENIGLTTMLHIHSLDGRTGAQALAGVKYFQTPEDKKEQLPFGYSRKVWTDGSMAVWENEYPVAFGFTTDKVIAQSDLEKLSGEQIEEIMLSAVSLEDGAAEEMEESRGLTLTDGSGETIGIRTQEISLPEGTDGIERTGTGYLVRKKKAALEIPYERKAGFDVLVGFSALVPDGMGSAMKVKASGISKRVTLLSSRQTYTLSRENYLVSLGYAKEDSTDTLRISFTKKGRYYLGAIRLVYIPRSGYEGVIAALNEYSLRDVSFGADTVTGSIHLDTPRFMLFQIPWSSGWSAEINGEDVPLLQADECYMGLPLPAGDHEICLTYRTPRGREGALLSLAGLILFLSGVILFRKKKAAHNGKKA